MKKIFKAKSSIIVAILFLFSTMLSACGNNESKTSTSSEQNKIVVTDGIGKKITLDKPAERIVVLPPCVSYVCALGCQDKIVGSGSGKNIEGKFIQKLLPDFSKIPDCVGKSKAPNPEEMMKVKPDLVIISGKGKDNAKILEDAGFKVFVAEGENIESLKETVVNLGKALGKEDRANQFVKYYDKTLKGIDEKLKNIEPNKKPKVYFAGSQILKTCSNTMYQNFMIEKSGGKNVSSELKGERWVKVSPEQIIKWNPDIIFIPQYSKTTTVEDVLKDPRWQQLSAVKNKRVYTFPANIISWDYPSVQTILGIEWMSKTINPDKFKDLDIISESDKFFTEFFGKSFTDLGGKLEKDKKDKKDIKDINKKDNKDNVKGKENKQK